MHKEKHSLEHPGADHHDFAPGTTADNISNASSSPNRPPKDMAPITHKMTTHGHRELVPQPSDDPRDPLVGNPP